MITIKFLSKAILKFFLYVLTSFVLMLTVTGLMSGRFPPPFKEYYQQLVAVNEALSKQSNSSSTPDFAKYLKEIADGRDQRNKFLNEIQQESFAASGAPAQRAAENHQMQNLEAYLKRIKYLEYEVAYYKAKLARSEWEKTQIKQNPDRTPSSEPLGPPNAKK